LFCRPDAAIPGSIAKRREHRDTGAANQEAPPISHRILRTGRQSGEIDRVSDFPVRLHGAGVRVLIQINIRQGVAS
jgi:hypothetical protein